MTCNITKLVFYPRNFFTRFLRTKNIKYLFLCNGGDVLCEGGIGCVEIVYVNFRFI